MDLLCMSMSIMTSLSPILPAWGGMSRMQASCLGAATCSLAGLLQS